MASSAAAIGDKIKKSSFFVAVNTDLGDGCVDLELNESEMQEITLQLKGLTFSSERPDTLLASGGQGDHVGSWALYLEYANARVQKYVLNSANKNYDVASLVAEITQRPRMDEEFLKSLGLLNGDFYDKQEFTPFVALSGEIARLRASCSKRMKAQYGNISAMVELKKIKANDKSSSVEKYAIIDDLTPDILRETIHDIRCNYFYMVSSRIAEKYLLYQNSARYVAFKKIPGQSASSSEGGDVRWSLYRLHNLASLQAQAKPNLDIVDDIVKDIDNLLFFPKIRDDNQAAHIEIKEAISDAMTKRLVADAVTREISDIVAKGGKVTKALNNKKNKTEKEAIAAENKKDSLRTNDLRVFCFVIARHLEIMSKTFEQLITPLQDQIASKFIDKMIIDWGLQDQEIDFNSWGIQDEAIKNIAAVTAANKEVAGAKELRNVEKLKQIILHLFQHQDREVNSHDFSNVGLSPSPNKTEHRPSFAYSSSSAAKPLLFLEATSTSQKKIDQLALALNQQIDTFNLTPRSKNALLKKFTFT